MNHFQKPIIHESAQVSPDAHLGPGVVIGPKVVIEGGVWIGAYSVIGSGPPEHRDFYDDLDGERTQGVLICKGARIFQFVTIHSGTVQQTFVGRESAVFQKAHLAHDVVIEDHATVGGQCSLAGHTLVMERAIIGGHSCTHQFSIVAPLGFLAPTAFLKGHIPVAEIWAGNPARPSGINSVGIQRAGLTHEEALNKWEKKFSELRHQSPLLT